MTIDMTRDETREEIVYKFACWAAASAARQGSKIRGRAWYKPIKKIKPNLDMLLSDGSPSQDRFAKWHKTVVEKLCDATGESLGWAAKILNMLTKVEVYLSELGHPTLKDLIHPPIENGLIDAVIEKCRNGCWGDDNATIKRLCSKGKPINSVKTYAQYMDVIKGLQLVAKCMQCPRFEVERLLGTRYRRLKSGRKKKRGSGPVANVPEQSMVHRMERDIKLHRQKDSNCVNSLADY